MLALASVTSTLLLVGSACVRQQRPPTELVDGRRAGPSIALEDVDSPTVQTAVSVLDLSHRGARRFRSCLRQGWSEPPTGQAAVVRTGVDGESVTLTNRARNLFYACDTTQDAGRSRPRWCGLAFGRSVDRRLLDPRLDLGGCRSGDGHPVAFAWVEPLPQTRYVVVHERSFAEVYRVVADVPVRITTTASVDLERSRATFLVSEQSASGDRLRTYALEANVAG